MGIIFSRRKFLAGASAAFATHSCESLRASQVQRGATNFFSTPPSIIQGIIPSIGVKSADLLPSGLANAPQRVNLSFLGGYEYVPHPDYCESFFLHSHLFRAVADVNGVTDANCSIELLQYAGASAMGNIGTAAFSNGHVFPQGALIEGMGDIEVPNILEADGTWANFCWQMSGNTVIGSSIWLELTKLKLVPGYTLPSAYPAKKSNPSVLALHLDTGLVDDSTAAHTINVNNVSCVADNSLKYDGQGSVYLSYAGKSTFDGSSSYLAFDGSGITLSGDFTIEVVISTTVQSLQGNCQRRILSLGNSAPAIGIDNSTGAVVFYREAVSALKIGGNPVISGYVMSIKWRRAGGVNTMIINGQQDGPSFADNTSWSILSAATIGKYCGSNVGFFSGNMHSINIVNGLAI